ncbi:hypothetical protein FISHEDRAFT_57438 [Fistulina hepatica ATCC 64428]|uniref:Uncharacterized protein n=1 Tax=Fistulina hepatica ATCC 64428 TaxID=1128425 RepID=A0A0D7AHJ6_9AGAR|nr:hypothetical protein FISHEDRAFT_57438 [Fistulina hepatica ATCC 64428]
MRSKSLTFDVPSGWETIEHIQLSYSSWNHGVPPDPVGEATIWGDGNYAKLVAVENPDDPVRNRILMERGFFKARIEGKDHTFVAIQIVEPKNGEDIDVIKAASAPGRAVAQQDAPSARIADPTILRYLGGNRIPSQKAGFVHGNVEDGHFAFASDGRVTLLSLGNVECNHKCPQKKRPELALQVSLRSMCCSHLKQDGWRLSFWREYMSDEEAAQYAVDKATAK